MDKQLYRNGALAPSNKFIEGSQDYPATLPNGVTKLREFSRQVFNDGFWKWIFIVPSLILFAFSAIPLGAGFPFSGFKILMAIYLGFERNIGVALALSVALVFISVALLAMTKKLDKPET